MDVRSFVRSFPPFDAQDDATIARVVDSMQIEFFSAGSVILPQPGEAPEYAFMVRTGAVELLDGDRLVDLLHPGEVFGHSTVRPSGSPVLTARAHEDTLCYLLYAVVMREIVGVRTGLTFLSANLRDRTARATHRAAHPPTRRSPRCLEAVRLVASWRDAGVDGVSTTRQ